MLRYAMPFLLLRVGDPKNLVTKNAAMKRRCADFLNGKWPKLFKEALEEAKSRNTNAKRKAGFTEQQERQSNKDWEWRCAAALEQAEAHNFSKAVSTLTSAGLAQDHFSKLLQKLQDLHPSEEKVELLEFDQGIPPSRDSYQFLTAVSLCKLILQSKAGVAGVGHEDYVERSTI